MLHRPGSRYKALCLQNHQEILDNHARPYANLVPANRKLHRYGSLGDVLSEHCQIVQNVGKTLPIEYLHRF